MPQVPKVAQLPVEVRAELDRRLVESGFSDIRGAAAWLTDLGHKVGKSAVGQYAQRNRESIIASAAASSRQLVDASDRRAEFRLAVLQVAASVCGPSDVLETADRLLNWIHSPA